MKSITKLALLITNLIMQPAIASSGVCDIDLYSIYFENVGGETLVRQKLIGKKVFSIEIPADSDPYDSFTLNASVEDFKISAMFEAGEKRVSNLHIEDDTHAIDIGGLELTSMSNFKNMKKITVFCLFQNSKETSK